MLNTLNVIFNTRHKIDVCVDRTRPALGAETTQLKQALDSTETKRIKVRYLTDITNDNLYYCKELLSIVDELRHSDCIQENFYVSENEYVAPESFHEKDKQGGMMIYSDIKEVVQHQQHIFESIWNASTSADEKIKEIEWNINVGATEIIDNPSKTKALFLDLVKSAKFEILLILPTVNAFLREYRIGAIQLFKRVSTGTDKELKESDEGNRAGRKKISIKILTPTNDLVRQIIDEMGIGSTSTTDNNIGISSKTSNLIRKKSSVFSPYSSENESDTQHLQIRYLESSPRYNVTTSTILVVDRKTSLVMEKIDDSKEEFNEAVGLSTYSTSKPTIASYVSIFENFWSQIELYEKLRANEKTEREFINLAAHELRTPTQAILGYIELAMMEYNNNDNNYAIDNEKVGYLRAVYRNALRLRRLTKDILDVARIESNTLKLNKDRFDLVEGINDVIDDIIHAQIVNKTKNNTEIVFNKPETALFITADRVRINEVISNLLSNAINASKNNGKITISIRLVESAKNDTYTNQNNNNNNNNDDHNNRTCVIVNIKDNGTGIDTEIEPKLFTKFATKSESGLGLGLYISRSIIEAHEGKIWGENNKDGNGATFTFSLYV